MTEDENSLSIRREREVDLWLEVKGVPKRNYVKLTSYCKGLLHNQICAPTKPTSPGQRRDLYEKLFLSGIVSGRKSNDLVGNKTDGEIKEFFSPSGLPYLYKF